MGGLAVRGHRGGRVFVGVRGCSVWVVRLLPVVVVASLATADVGVDCAVSQFAVAAAVACLSVCEGLRFGWFAR